MIYTLIQINNDWFTFFYNRKRYLDKTRIFHNFDLYKNNSCKNDDDIKLYEYIYYNWKIILFFYELK